MTVGRKKDKPPVSEITGSRKTEREGVPVCHCENVKQFALGKN